MHLHEAGFELDVLGSFPVPHGHDHAGQLDQAPLGELFKSILELPVAPDSEVVSGFFGCSIDHAVAVDRHVDAGAFLSGLGVFTDSACDVGFVDELAIEGVVHRPKVQDGGVFVLNQEFSCD